MPLTLEIARAEVLHRLDDERGRRYNEAGDYAKIDRALDIALSTVLDSYISAGGERFDEDVDVTTEDDGTVDLTAYNPAHIKGVLVVPEGDTAYHQVQAIDRKIKGLPASTSYDLRIVLVRRLAVPKDHPDQFLVGGATQGARSWEAFDDLVIAHAARRLAIKDDEQRKSLLDDIVRLESSVFGAARTPKAVAWPDAVRARWSFSRQLRWGYEANDQSLKLYHSGTP